MSSDDLKMPSAEFLTNHEGYDNCDMKTNGEENFLREIAPSVKLAFDVGANIGDWTGSLLKYGHPDKIFAFEPHPQIYSKLVEKHKNYEGFSAHQLALSCEKTNKNLIVWNNPLANDNRQIELSGLNGLYHREILKNLLHKTPTEIPVICDTLDSFCKEKQINQIDLLKIDTEGSELDVLIGSKEMLENKAIRQIQFEYGGTYLDSHILLETVYNLLIGYGYRIFRILPGRLLPIPFWNPVLENFKYSNYVAKL